VGGSNYKKKVTPLEEVSPFTVCYNFSMNKIQPLYPNNYYHIFNRAINKDRLFVKEDNYFFFLKRFDFYLSPFLEVFAFCLIPNHFHFLVRIRTPKVTPFQKVSPLISEKFRFFFTSYTMALNKSLDRHGNLFERPFKRKLITTDDYLRHLIYYIHNNPIHHDLVDNIEDWPFSSYNRILSDKPSKLQKAQVLDWFDGKKNYREFHTGYQDLKSIEELIVDD
jgi:putative transposase